MMLHTLEHLLKRRTQLCEIPFLKANLSYDRFNVFLDEYYIII